MWPVISLAVAEQGQSFPSCSTCFSLVRFPYTAAMLKNCFLEKLKRFQEFMQNDRAAMVRMGYVNAEEQKVYHEDT